MKTSILNETNVALNTTFQPMLTDLQGNILKGHGRDFAQHIFIRFNAVEPAKKWMQTMAKDKIKSAWHQLEQAQIRNNNPSHDGGTFYTLSLTSVGYDFFELCDKAPLNAAFKSGLASRKNILNDNLGLWEQEFTTRAHVLLIVADDSESKLEGILNEITSELMPFGTILKAQKGQVLKHNNVGIEHFGYADGISQPIYLKDEIDQEIGHEQWCDKATLDKVLVADPGGLSEESYGSLLVFRKLEQNVIAFKEAEKKLKEIRDAKGQPNDELAGAMVVGRFESGVPVTKNSEDKNGITNDFDYRDDKAGLQCPYHAHIRLTNPRSDISDPKNIRITRRGIPFNDCGRDVTNLEEDLRDKGVGLLFMCYQSNIEKQFEFIQKILVNDGDIDNKLVGQDGIIGQGANDFKKQLPYQWGQATSFNECDFANPEKGFVKMRGGDYFFTPSISFLNSLTDVL